MAVRVPLAMVPRPRSSPFLQAKLFCLLAALRCRPFCRYHPIPMPTINRPMTDRTPRCIAIKCRVQAMPTHVVAWVEAFSLGFSPSFSLSFTSFDQSLSSFSLCFGLSLQSINHFLVLPFGNTPGAVKLSVIDSVFVAVIHNASLLAIPPTLHPADFTAIHHSQIRYALQTIWPELNTCQAPHEQAGLEDMVAIVFSVLLRSPYRMFLGPRSSCLPNQQALQGQSLHQRHRKSRG